MMNEKLTNVEVTFRDAGENQTMRLTFEDNRIEQFPLPLTESEQARISRLKWAEGYPRSNR